MGRRTLKLTPLINAISLIMSSLEGYSPAVETVAAEEAVGRVAATHVAAAIDVPPYSVAALDGVAANSGDIKQASTRNAVKLLLAQKNDTRLRRGEAIPVATGDKIPEGADVVIKRENLRFLGQNVEVVEPLTAGKNIVWRGEEMKAGDLILEKGGRIRPEEVTMLMAAGITEVAVNARVRVGITSVGDELYAEFLKRGISAVNHSYLAARKIEGMGCMVTVFEVVRDDPELLAEKIREATSRCDVVVTVGGCSVGENDIVPQTVSGIPSARLLFHGLRCNPAKPAGYATIGSKPLLMLPGHVVSMLGALYLLGKPLLNRLQGLQKTGDQKVFALCTSDPDLRPGMGNLILVSLEEKDGAYLAHPLPWGTNSLRNLVKADGYVLVDEGGSLKAGQQTAVHLLT